MLTPPIPARPQPLTKDPLPTRIPTYREASTIAKFLACHCWLVMGSMPRSWCVQKGEAIPRHKGGFTRVLYCGVPPLTIVASPGNPR